MISGTLLRRNLKCCFKPLLVIFGVMCMYMVVIIYMFDPEFAEMLNGYQDLMPGMMAAVGMTGIATSLLELSLIHI